MPLLEAATLAVAKGAPLAAMARAAYVYLTLDPRWWWKKREKWTHEVKKKADWESTLIHGKVAPGWEAVRDEFLQNFRVRGELGAGICVYHRGIKVVDLWGGYRDTKGNVWERDTLVPVFSTTKGVSMISLVLLHSRGLLDFDERVATYWPDFAQNGKGTYTVRQLVNHECGLAGPSPPITLDQLMDKDVTKDFYAAVKPFWPNPGDFKGYMAISLGNYQSAIVQSIDQEGRTVGQFLRDEVFKPLGIDDAFYVGLPKEVPDARLAVLDAMVGLEGLFVSNVPPGLMTRLLLRPSSYTARAFANPRLGAFPSLDQYNMRRVKEAELPACNGQATAHAVATIYRALERAINTGGAENPLGFTSDSLEELMVAPRPSRCAGWRDEVVGMDMFATQGMMKPAPESCGKSSPGSAFGVDQRAFGTAGAGGSFGFCDPTAGVAFGYVMNRCGQCLFDDPREFMLRLRVYECAQKVDGHSYSIEHLREPFWLSKEELARCQ